MWDLSGAPLDLRVVLSLHRLSREQHQRAALSART